MRTTVDLPDLLFRQAKARAAMEGISLKELIARCLKTGLDAAHRPAGPKGRHRRSELPVVRKATGRKLPVLDNAMIHRILNDEDAANARKT